MAGVGRCVAGERLATPYLQAPQDPVGAGLLAKRPCRSIPMLNDPPFSRASPLPQGVSTGLLSSAIQGARAAQPDHYCGSATAPTAPTPRADTDPAAIARPCAHLPAQSPAPARPAAPTTPRSAAYS